MDNLEHARNELVENGRPTEDVIKSMRPDDQDALLATLAGIREGVVPEAEWEIDGKLFYSNDEALAYLVEQHNDEGNGDIYVS